MKVIVGESFMSVKDVVYAMLQPVCTNEDETSSVFLPFDPKWGILKRISYRFREWLNGPVTEEEYDDPEYEYHLIVEYIDEWDRTVKLKTVYTSYQNGKTAFDKLMAELERVLPQEKMRMLNEQILSE